MIRGIGATRTCRAPTSGARPSVAGDLATDIPVGVDEEVEVGARHGHAGFGDHALSRVEGEPAARWPA